MTNIAPAGGIRLPFRGVLPRIAPDAFVAPTATIIGDVVIGSLANIWFGCVIRGDVNEIRIGANAYFTIRSDHAPAWGLKEYLRAGGLVHTGINIAAILRFFLAGFAAAFISHPCRPDFL